MTKGELYQVHDSVVKILSVECDEVFVIDCKGTRMPKWMEIAEVSKAEPVGTEMLQVSRKESDLSDVELAVARERYSMIAGILPYVSDYDMMLRTCCKSSSIITSYTIYTCAIERLINESSSGYRHHGQCCHS